MSSQSNSSGSNGSGPEDIVRATRRGIAERLSDPYLTDHDRWVLRQFGRFLSGVAPEPDPRASKARARERLSGSGEPIRFR